MTELENAIKILRYDVIGLAETYWKGVGRVDRASTGDAFFYNGGEHRKDGSTGFIVSRRWKDAVRNFLTPSPRISAIDIEFVRGQIYRIIQVYAPSTGHDVKEFEGFLESLETLLQTHRTHATGEPKSTVFIGDWNAKVGSKMPNSDETCVGIYGCGDRNERGELLVQWCEAHKLFVANTFYKKRTGRRWTWEAPNGRTRNAIDFALLRDKRQAQDLSVIGFFSREFYSDHRMLRLCTNGKTDQHFNSRRMPRCTTGLQRLDRPGF